MADLISRAAAMKAFMGKPPEYYHTSYIVGEINCLPAVDAIPAEWLRQKMRQEDESEHFLKAEYIKELILEYHRE